MGPNIKLSRLVGCLIFLLSISGHISPAAATQSSMQQVKDFYPQVMNAAPILPADLNSTVIGTELTARHSHAKGYLTAAQVDYFQPNWESRIASDWQFFSAAKTLGRILVIDYSQAPNTEQPSLAYRYLANQNTQDGLFEPWSASKIFAYTAAVAKVRQLSQGKVGAQSAAGNTPIADLITSIHTYKPFGQADGNSNAIASYFVNLAGRDHLTALFHDKWLMLANPSVRFRGAYANKVFEPNDHHWQTKTQRVAIKVKSDNLSHLDYQAYRCKHCGLTGNKPMTNLAQAEWLKRLTSHQREPLTRHPHLTQQDVQVLFFGTGHSDKHQQHGGMIQGISLMLHHALATAIAGTEVDNPKQVLDQATQGQWRVWQKIGWGYSETRQAGENVLLAHVSLPHFKGGMEFTISAQTAEPSRDPISVNFAGMKMQRLLTQSIKELLVQHR